MHRLRWGPLVTACGVIAMTLSVSACNTTKATVDTTVKFFSSTSPDSMFTADGLVEQKEKINLFAGMTFENLRQDVAQGKGQYLTSLAVLMNVPPSRHDEFAAFLQSRYATLFTTDLTEDRLAHLKFVAALDREVQAHASPGQ